jgi:hypothetical protein
MRKLAGRRARTLGVDAIGPEGVVDDERCAGRFHTEHLEVAEEIAERPAEEGRISDSDAGPGSR